MYACVTSKGQITLPREVRNQLNLATGSIVSVVVKNGRAELIPVEDDVMALRGRVPANDPQDFDVIEGVYTCDSSSIEEKKRIASIESIDKLQNLQQRKHVIKGDPEDLVNITWDKEMNLDLP